MRLIIQRVSSARVDIEGATVGGIGPGLVILVAVRIGDTSESAKRLASKAARLRIFSDDEGKMNLSAMDIGGAVLVVSQFTLYADTRKGNRPSFVEAAPGAEAELLINEFTEALRSDGLKVAEGRFGAHMQVTLTNDGPVTILLDD